MGSAVSSNGKAKVCQAGPKTLSERTTVAAAARRPPPPLVPPSPSAACPSPAPALPPLQPQWPPASYDPSSERLATFAGGCFWSVELAFQVGGAEPVQVDRQTDQHL